MMRASLPFPQQLKYEREQRNWTRAELATRVEADTKTVARWETGKSLPRAYHRRKLTELFEKNMEELGLDGESAAIEDMHQEDWGTSPLVEAVYGRTKEFQQLKHWIVDDRCRLVSLLGMGGMGKTTLAAYLTGQIKDEFAFIFWRSVQHAPPLEHILKQALQFFSAQMMIDFPSTVDDSISLLISYLQNSRCLFILDNFESVLQSGQHAGHYREGYESYGILLQRLGEVQHDSCLLLTSREKPREIALMEGPAKAVRTLLLSGITSKAGQALLADKNVYGSHEQWKQLIALYGGNPLALKLVSEYIEGIFGGSIDLFLAQKETLFGDVNELLEHQFRRLTSQEQEVLVWLAIEREPIALESLRENFARPIPRSALLEALHSLQRRSFIEMRAPAQFTLQPVIMEYITDKLVQQASDEFQAQATPSWANYAFMKATAPNYIRENQLRFILHPLAEYLQTLDTREGLLEKLHSMLSGAKHEHMLKHSYLAGNVLNVLNAMQHDNLRSVDFSSLAIRQAYLQGASLVDVNFAHATFKESVFTSTFGNILSVAFSSQHNLLAAGSATGEISVYAMPEEQLIHTYSGHTDGVWSLAFSADGQLLASSSDDWKIRLWDMRTQACIAVLQKHTNRVRSVAFNSEGTLLASGSDDATIRLWNVSTGQLQFTLCGHTSRVWAVAFSPNGGILASGSTDATIRLWDSSTGRCLKILTGHTQSIRSLAFSSDGSLLASGSDDQTIRIWNLSTDSSMRLQGHTNRVWSIAFSQHGTTLASGGEDSTVRLWDARTGNVLNILQNHTHGVRSVAFSPDGATLASGGDDQAICLWSVESGYCLKKIQGHTNRVWSIAFGADMNTLVSGSEDHAIRLWDTKTGQTRYAEIDHSHAARSIAMSPDGTMLASGGQDQKVWLWHIRNGSRVRVLQGHTNWVWSVAFHPHGQILASGSEDTTIRLWEVSSGRELKILEGHNNWIRSIAFSSNGQMLASGSDDQKIKLWDVATGFCLYTLQGHTHRVRSVAFSPNGAILASSSEDQTIRLWNVQTQETLYVLKGHTDWVRSVSFSSDNQLLASGGEDAMLRLWNVNTGECIAVLDGHTNRIRSLCFSPDGTLLASGSDDGTILLWDIATFQPVRTLKSERPYERMNISYVTGLSEGQKAALRALGAIETTISGFQQTTKKHTIM